jgi:transcriptional regulator with XRE-family HTH domain
MIRENLKTAIARSGLFIKEVAAKSGVKKRTIDKWVGSEETEPRVIDLYKVCVALRITMEEVADGEAGIQYIREYVREKGWQFAPPERIADIVEAADRLSDEQLDYVMGLIKTMLDKKEDSGAPPEIKSGEKTG